MIDFSALEPITGGTILRISHDQPITLIIIDSRKAVAREGAVFFAISGDRHDGHSYIPDLYASGVRQFVCERPIAFLDDKQDVNVLITSSSVAALQRLVAHHRQKLTMPVIGIAGSNGKTIVKEWLYHLLSVDHKIAKNPGSYNSQVGVPLSVWQLQPHHELGIFEAGVSRPTEMERLASVIHPTIGIFTNLGSAHDEGFTSRHQKLSEKLKLFQSCKVVIYCNDHSFVREMIEKSGLHTLSWGSGSTASIHIRGEEDQFTISFKGSSFPLTLPFRDRASVENCFHCVSLMLHLGYSGSVIQQRISTLQAVPMRLELKDGINQSQIIDDTYNNDLAGLQISLDFLTHQHQKKTKRLILSEILESGYDRRQMVAETTTLIQRYSVDKIVTIGAAFLENKDLLPPHASVYANTEKFLNEFPFDEIQQEVVLVKGARAYRFETIIERLQRKVHGTVMEIDLGALVHNLNYFKSLLRATTKIMAMVKAFAYGSGSTEIANLLQYHKVDYLGVAYADEGVELRKNNIELPIMVMNPTEESFGTLLHHRLEPEIYSFKLLNELIAFLKGRSTAIHIKLDTGMHRLGFMAEDLSPLLIRLREHPNIRVASIFSHLAGADERAHDRFSEEQGRKFNEMAEQISSSLSHKPLFHLLNSPGILRFSHLQFDMVRLGIGLYGIDPTAEQNTRLRPVATLKTVISQIREIDSGQTVGYGRRGIVSEKKKVATIAIGYADGFSRAFSRGVGKVLIKDQLAPIIGNVCMDMSMVDITGIDAKEGDEVIIFGSELPIQNVANWANTIPYEILTNTSERVRRIFVAESI